MSTQDKITGSIKEVVGDAVGDEDLEAEGQHQQEKARKEEEAEELREAAETKEQEASGHAGAEKAAEQRS